MINYLSDLTGCEILGKAEFLNPGGSVKDRAALGILNDAIKNKKLKKDGIIVAVSYTHLTLPTKRIV